MKRKNSIPHFSQKKADAAEQEFCALVCAFLVAHGGTMRDTAYGYNWTLPTKFGPYHVSVHYRDGDSLGCLTVCGSFEDILRQQRADFGKPEHRPFPAGFPANHHKWNHHFGTYQEVTPKDAFEQWERAMAHVL